MKRPIIGQEAICSDGLGRVMAFKDEFPEQWIQVSTYFNDNQSQWAPDNVELIDPVITTKETVMVEKHGTDNQIPQCSECNVCGLPAVPPINGKCFACEMAEHICIVPLPDDMVTVTCEGKSIELYREAAIALGLIE